MPFTRKVYSLAVAIALTIVFTISCSVIKTESNDQEVFAFLTKFRNDLNLPSHELVTRYFQNTNQPRETLIQALDVLKNTDSLITCSPRFESPSIVRFEERTQVGIPVTFTSANGEEVITKETELIIWLERPQENFIVTELSGDKFYQAYTAVKNEREWAEERELELQKREPIYALADSLEEKYDSVIWYAQYRDSLFFYAVAGSWRNYFMKDGEVAVQDYYMGLINAAGDTLIPFQYDLIGTLAFTEPGLVEVRRDNKYGYFHLDSGKVVVEPVYDMIIPYHKEEGVWAMVLTDSVYGWIDTDFQFREGFPSEKAMSYVQNFEYLQDKIVLKSGNQTFCEIPGRAYVGFGIIIPPSYYVKNSLFAAIVGGINTTQVPMNGWTDYIEAKNSFVNRIGDNIRALISVLQERYIGGREEFYGSSQVTFVNENEQVMATVEMPTDQQIYFTHVDDFTIELMATAPGYHFYPPGGERDIPVYKYFRMSGDTLAEVESKRMFPFTEFVKIDSSYLEGPFSMYVKTEPTAEEEVVEESENTEASESQEEVYEEEYEEPTYETINFLTLPTIEYMRDEILVANGYQPNSTNNIQTLKRRRFFITGGVFNGNTSLLNAIDRHNYEFLTRVIELMQSTASGI